MQYDLLIERTLRNAQGILRANLPPAKNLPDDQAVQSLRAIVRTPQVREVLERGNDTALCFVLRAVNRILSDDDQPNRTKINRLWDVLDEPKFNRALGLQQNRHGISGELKGFADFRRDRNGNIVPRLCVANRSGRPPTLLDLFELSWLLFRLPTKPPARPRTIANNQRRVPTGDARAL